MKNVRRIVTLALALIMILSLATTAFAAETDITFTGGAAGAEYSAYRLLNATDGGEGKYAYTLNEKYTAILQAETGKTTEADIREYISNLDAAGIRAFAKDVYDAIVAAQLTAEYTTTEDKITGAEQGYYLIAETKLGDYGEGYADDTWSLLMIDTVGDTEVTVVTKESVPTIDKEVFGKNDSTNLTHWEEYADYDVGDTIPYRFTATVSGQYDNYINYWYSIEDEMSAGLTYNNDLVIKIADVDITSQFTITEHPSGKGFVATANLKEVDAALDNLTITKNSVITATYSCILNESAVSGVAGNPNKIKLKYQNDPYAEENPENPGETPVDTNIVFTYDSIVNKVDKDGNPLEGAGFTLYKWILDENDWVQIGAEIKDVTTFEYRGLDAGIYKLVETTIPEGYNKADDIEFTIKATYDETKDPVELIALEVVDSDGDAITSFSIDMTPGEVETNVVNNAGAELPETGGMGTTLFYVFGSIMVLGAAILLVTKKRMAGEA